MGMFDDLAPQKGAPTGGGMFDDIKPQKRDVGAIDRTMAFLAGRNRGLAADLAGLPVDTAANIIDLGKAAIGYGTSKVTGKAPPQWTEPYDRSVVPGSSEWIAKQINKGTNALGVSSAIDNPNPEDMWSRVLYSGGRVSGASAVPNKNAPIGGAQQVVNQGMGAAGGISAGLTAELFPEWAGLAGMLPSTVAAATIAGSKRAIRGNEAGRREMEQRIQDFKNAGVEEPSLGLATGNRTIQGIENILSQTPGSVGVFEKNKNALLSGMQARTNALRDRTSAVFGPEETGAAIQSDLKGAFKDRIGATTRALNDRVEQAVGPEFFTNPVNAIASAKGMSTPIPGAEATSSALINQRIAGIAKNLAGDVVGTPITSSSLMNAPTQYRRFDGVVSDAPPGIPFRTLKNLRTSIGDEAASNAIMGTPEQGQFKRLYGAMSQDMRQAVNAADRRNAGVEVGPLLPSQQPGAVALNKANDYYSKAMSRAEELGSIANRNTPEGAYTAVAKSLESGPTIYQRLRGAVTPETRQKIVASVIDDLGKASPGQQGVEGDAWSPRTFLTNYNKIDTQARSELFKRIPGGERLAADLKDVAKAAEMVSEGSKVWANPSGTTPAMVSRATLGALTVGAFFQPFTAAGTAGGLLIGNQASQRLLLNPRFVNWLARAPKVRPQEAQSYAQRLIGVAQMTNDKQFQQDVSDYLSSVENGINNQGNTGNE